MSRYIDADKLYELIRTNDYKLATKDGNPILDKLPFAIINKRVGDITIWYELTEQGLAWLGRQLKITIREV